MPRAKPEPDPETVQLTRELIRARLETQNLHNLETAGRLVDRQAAEFAIGDIIARAKMFFMALPARVAPQLHEIAQTQGATALQMALRGEIMRIFNEIAHAERLEAERSPFRTARIHRKLEKRQVKHRTGEPVAPSNGAGRGGRPTGRVGVKRY
jgi:hypothetical protein